MAVSLAAIIVCLGQRLLPNGSLPLSLQERVQTAVGLHKELRQPILFTGGVTNPALPSTSEADAMHMHALKLRYVSECYLERFASNTLENALYSADLIRRSGSSELHLVTNDFHAPRAVRIFRHVMSSYRVEVIGHAADSRVPWSSSSPEMPSMATLLDNEIRSILGLNDYFKKYGLAAMSNESIAAMVEEVEELRLRMSQRCSLREEPE